MTEDRTILLIEDSDTQAVLLTDVLEKDGMRVHRAATAEEGLEYLRAHRPDLVVVDYHLPGMQGDEFCRRIRDNSATDSIPLLILTEDTESSIERHGLDCGADDYVAKSTDSDVLLARIDLLLRRSNSDAKESSFFKTQKILVVDDSPTFLTLLEEELKREGYGVYAVENGEEALEIINNQQVDCIVIDLVMPGMDGIELCKRIKGHPQTRAVPVFVVSARPGREVVDRSLAAGAEDFIRKPFENEELMDRIRRLLGAVGNA